MDNNSMEELRMLVARLERLFDQQHGFNQDTNARFALMAERWDGYIIEQRQINQEMRQFNQRLQSILERLPPRGGAN
jgi:hypothetical protein